MVVLDFPVANGAYEGCTDGLRGRRDPHQQRAPGVMTTALLTKGEGKIRLMERKQAGGGHRGAEARRQRPGG